MDWSRPMKAESEAGAAAGIADAGRREKLSNLR
jgi:hypothetical protein